MSVLDIGAVSASSFFLIFVAELGDKSQLVCMSLARRHRPLPVIVGASLAFVVLNSVAVFFGAGISRLIPPVYISAVVAILFGVFGIQSWCVSDEVDDQEDPSSAGSIIRSTFLLIAVAEFGDKTQLAVVALSSASIPLGVWIGATLALVSTSALGVWAGRTVLQRFPLRVVRKISGVFFILLACAAVYKSIALGL